MESLTLVSFIGSEKAEAIRAELLSSFVFNSKTDQNNTTFLFLFDSAALQCDSNQRRAHQLLQQYQHCLHFCVIYDSVTADLLDNLSNPFLSLFNDLVFWPCQPNEIVTRIVRFKANTPAPAPLSENLLQEFIPLNLIGKSSAFTQVLALIKKVSQYNAPVIIEGETGTGKENAARAIHYLGHQSDQSFIPVNCSALPEELIESELFGHSKGAFTDAKQEQQGLVALADNGTLFLDEVDSLSPKAQAVLLRFLQTGEYRPLGSKATQFSKVRVIAATNADIQQQVENGKFREDLLFRLNVLNIDIPPLRERSNDIPALANSFLQKFSEQYNTPMKTLTATSLQWLQCQSWPGNVRELENTLLRYFLLSENEFIHISENSSPSPSSNHQDDQWTSFQAGKAAAIRQFEKSYLTNLLKVTEGNVSEAARVSGKERRALGKLLQKYRIEKERFYAPMT